MASNFDLLVAQLTVDANLHEIANVLNSQNSILESTFISEFYSSILTLERWTWQLLGKNSHQYCQQSTYFDFFRTLALFNKNLVFHYDTINSVTKAAVIIPDTIEWINDIFTQLANITDENDTYIYIVSMWFDNLSLFLFENPEYEVSPAIVHINRYIAQNYIMTDQYKFYLSQLAQPSVSQTIFTAKQLFYLKTCSLSLSSYLFAKAQDFLYTSSDILQHIGPYYIQIIILHTQTIESWSSSLLTCITHLVSFFVSCCWWGGENSPPIRILFANEAGAGVYINALIRIVEHKPFRQYLSSRQSSDHTILLDRTLFSLINISQNQEMIWFLRSKPTLIDVLIELAETSVYDRICLCIFSILAEILSNERLKELKIPDSASSYFFRILEHAWNHPLKKFKQIPIYYILKRKSYRRFDRNLRY